MITENKNAVLTFFWFRIKNVKNGLIFATMLEVDIDACGGLLLTLGPCSRHKSSEVDIY